MHPNRSRRSSESLPVRRGPRKAFLALAAPAAGLLILAGCDDAGDLTDVPAAGELSVRFAASPGPSDGSAAPSMPSAPAGVSIQQRDGAIVLEGTNGTLELTGIRMIVEEFEVEGEGGTEDFEAGPFFVELPLDGTAVDIASGPLLPGRYDELDFEVGKLDNQEEDLVLEIRDRFPEWPEDASMRVAGSFTPSFDSESRAFEVFLEAEVEIELKFSPPLEVSETEGEVAVVTVAPGLWFARGDGSVVELSRWDHRFGDEDLQELEVEIENGFLQVEWDN